MNRKYIGETDVKRAYKENPWPGYEDYAIEARRTGMGTGFYLMGRVPGTVTYKELCPIYSRRKLKRLAGKEGKAPCKHW